MPTKASVLDLISSAAKGRVRAYHLARPHPTFPTTAKSSRYAAQHLSASSTSSHVSRNQHLPRSRRLSTASRPPAPPPPQTSTSAQQPEPSPAQTPAPSSTHINPIDPDLAASEAERIAFSSLAFTLSITNSGYPIHLSDLDSTAPDARSEPSSLYLHHESTDLAYTEAAYSPDFEFAPLPFTTSITNTGSPIDEFDWNINSVDPGLVRDKQREKKRIFIPRSASGWEGITIPAQAPAPPSAINTVEVEVEEHAGLIHPDFPASTTGNAVMSDADYTAFLEKQSGSSGGVEAQSTGSKDEFSASSTDAEVPPALQNIKATYTSEADEPFRPVSLKLGGSPAGDGKISLDTFKDVTSQSRAEEISQKDFDPQDQYSNIVKSIEEAGNGKAQIFRVELKGARAEYWIVSLDKEGTKMVGVKAGSVES